jgi:hypothetical protein
MPAKGRFVNRIESGETICREGEPGSDNGFSLCPIHTQLNALENNQLAPIHLNEIRVFSWLFWS